MSPTRPRRAAVLSSMSATLRLVAVFAVAASEQCRQPVVGMQSRAACFATALQQRCDAGIFGTAPDFFLQ